MAVKTFFKQPSEREDFDFDFTGYLSARGNDTLVTATIVASAGLTVDSSFIVDSKTVKFFCSGGDNGVQYRVTCIVSTAGGRIKEKECLVHVVDD